MQLGSPWRLRTIYNTNMKSAYNAGREEFYQKNKANRPYGQFVAVMDPKTRDEHAELHGKVFHLDDSFWDSFTPPLDFNCRCRKRALSPAAVKRKKLKVLKSKPSDFTREDQVVSKRTGETRKVTGYRLPGGGKVVPRAGFDTNQWKSKYQPDLEKYPYDLARQYGAGALRGPAFKRFFEGKDKGAFPLAVMNAETRALMPAGMQTVRMKHGVMKKITRRKHPDITIEDMLRAQEAVDDGMVIQPEKTPLKREFFLERDGFLWVFPVKETARTFFKITLGTKKHKRFLEDKRKGKVLREQRK